jgi:uncharacterized damage-inducible protein DinB
MQQTEWFNRKFPLIEDNGLLPTIIERLIGTPARIEALLQGLNPALLTVRRGEKWTIKEEIGHLYDLEPLWIGRLDDLLNGLTELRVTDLTNQKTHTANHNAAEMEVLQQSFSGLRQQFVIKLAGLTAEQLVQSALHPRLKTPMRIIDLAWFVAEHDDHHLVNIRRLLK